MKSRPARSYTEPEGPFRARQIREGTPYELSNGHPIKCMSAGERHGVANIQGAFALGTDPAIKGQIGADVGVEFNEGKNLRAPDLVLGIEGRPGYATAIPPICVEYADRGQDEVQLQQKIGELLQAGVRHIWVVRLAGPLRVEVYEPGKRMRVVDADGELRAPEVLANTYTPRELVDQEAALRAAFRNQLQALGYQSLDELRAEARKQAEAERDEAQAARVEAQAARVEALRVGIVDLCEVLGLKLSEARRRQLGRLDAEALDRLRQAIKSGRRWPRGT